MSIEHTIPRLRDLPAGRLEVRRNHLVAAIQSDLKRKSPVSAARWLGSRRRVAVLALAFGLLAIGTAVAAATTDWLAGTAAPKTVVSDFGSYTRQLGFDPEPGRAVLVAQDGDVLLYATTNKQGSYCLIASASWKRPDKLPDGGTCIPPADARAPLVAGLVGASGSPDGRQTYLIAGRASEPDARAIRFGDPDGADVTRPIGSSGFFIAAIHTDDSACAYGDWKPTFSVLGPDGKERGSATITLGSASSASPGVCAFATPHP